MAQDAGEVETSWIQQYSWVPGVVIGVIGVIVTITIATIVFKKNKKWKTLDYIVLSDVHLLSSSASDVKDLVVNFRGRELSAPRVITIKFVNTGNQEIKQEDFVDPITVSYCGSTKVLDLFVVDSSKPNMLDRVTDQTAGSTYVNIVPRLMNANDWFTVQFFYDGTEAISVNSWVTGETRPSSQILEGPGTAKLASQIFLAAGAQAAQRFLGVELTKR